MGIFKKKLITKDKMYEIVVEDTFKALESYNVNIDEFRESYYNDKMTEDEFFKFISMGIPNDSKSPALKKMINDIKCTFETGNKEYSLYNLVSLSYMMRHQGLRILFRSNSAYFDTIRNVIAIDKDDSVDTSIHELGHAIHYNLRNQKIPKYFFKILRKAKINIKKREDIVSLVNDINQKNEFYNNYIDEREYEEYDKYEKVIRKIDTLMRESSSEVPIFYISKILKLHGLNSCKADTIKKYLSDKILKNQENKNYDNLIKEIMISLSKIREISPTCVLYSDLLGGLILKDKISNRYGETKKISTHYSFYYLWLKNVFYELFANYNVCCCYGNNLVKGFEKYFGSDLLESVQEIYDWKKFEVNKEELDNDVDIQFLKSLLQDITREELNKFNKILFQANIDDFIGNIVDSIGSYQCAKILSNYYFNGELDESLTPIIKEELTSLNKMQIRKIILEILPPFINIHEKFQLEAQEAEKIFDFNPEYVGKEIISFSDSENVIDSLKAYDCYEDITYRKYKIIRDEDINLKIEDLSQILIQLGQSGIDINFIRNIIVFDEEFMDNNVKGDTIYIYKNSNIDDIRNMIENYIKQTDFTRKS